MVWNLICTVLGRVALLVRLLVRLRKNISICNYPNGKDSRKVWIPANWLSMLEHKVQLDSNCAISLAQFNTVVGN